MSGVKILPAPGGYHRGMGRQGFRGHDGSKEPGTAPTKRRRAQPVEEAREHREATRNPASTAESGFGAEELPDRNPSSAVEGAAQDMVRKIKSKGRRRRSVERRVEWSPRRRQGQPEVAGAERRARRRRQRLDGRGSQGRASTGEQNGSSPGLTRPTGSSSSTKAMVRSDQ